MGEKTQDVQSCLEVLDISTMNMYPLLSSPHVTVPFPWKADMKKQLVRDMESGILEQVPAKEPTVWQSPS